MYIYVMKFQISYIKLDHTLYSINFGNCEGDGPLMHNYGEDPGRHVKAMATGR